MKGRSLENLITFFSFHRSFHEKNMMLGEIQSLKSQVCKAEILPLLHDHLVQ